MSSSSRSFPLSALTRCLEEEAAAEVTRACGHELWNSLGFDALDSLEDPDRRARANYYYGQLQTARELKDVLG